MFICNVNKNNIKVTERETITSGSVNAFECEFVFSDDWDILQRTVSFKADDTVISVMLDNNNRCIIPWEVLATPDVELYVGVVGYGDMGTEAKEDDITLPTIWAYLGTIVHGTNDGEDPTPPTPGVYEQIMIKLADLEANKQDKITGKQGQVVGFDANGNAIAQDDTGGVTYTAGDNIHISEDNVISADMYDDTSVKADIAALQTATADNTNKINSNTEAITKKQNTLTAGTNITIENDIISASSYDDSEITADVETLKSTKQDKITGKQGQVVGFDANGNPVAQDDTGGVTYTAGANIHISEDNVISADMYDDTSVNADIAALQTATASNTEAISNKQNTLTAGDNIHISSDNVISADMYDDTNIKSDIAALQTATASNAEAISKKQNTLTAGANITIENNTISAASYDDAEILAEISALDSGKQNKLTGTQNQIVGFDENGNAIAREGGADGYSPTVSIEDVPGGNQVTITDKNGPHSFDVMDGVDGFSPTVSIEETPGGNEITITDKNGAHSFTAIDSVPAYTIAEVSANSAEEKAYRLKRDGTAEGSTIVTRKHGIYYDGIGPTQYVENNAISIAGVVDSYGASVGMSVDKPRANIYFIEEFEDYYVSDFNLYRAKEPANKNSSGSKNIRFSSGANKVTNLYLLIYQTATATYPKCLIHHTYVLEPSGNLDGGYITVTDRSGAQFNVDKLLMQGKIVAGTFVTGYKGYYLALSPLFLSGEKSVAISQGFYALTQL